MWTRFMDMHSGGGQKEKFAYIYIEAPRQEAEVIFQNRFGHNPNRVTCTCCGEDYSISEHETLEEATGYDRGCDYEYMTPDGEIKSRNERQKAVFGGNNEWKTWKGHYVERERKDHLSFNPFTTPSDYLASHKDVLIIRTNKIKLEERQGQLKRSGYVWVDE